ncbi:MAG: hypothetical protein KC620_06155, partial [Myxococcales bacterium]|nr:hypothetical protein [Myxococcales bacterium]
MSRAASMLLMALLAAPAWAGPSVNDPQALAALRADAPEGDEVAPMSPELRTALQSVRTNPGDLPRLKLRHEGKLYDLPLQKTEVDIQVAGHVAQVEVRQRYRNPFVEPIETIYVFPLPENSAVTDLRFEIGDRIVESALQPRAQARQTYEAAKRAGHTAALLEQERPNG